MSGAGLRPCVSRLPAAFTLASCNLAVWPTPSRRSVSSIVHPPAPPERHWLVNFIPAHPIPAFIVMAAVVLGVIFASVQATNIPSSAVVLCTGDQNHDTAALRTAITNARNDGTVNVAALSQ